MTAYRLPATCRLVVFDVDNTLYRNDDYLRRQTELLIERFARERRMAVDEARRAIEKARVEVARASKSRTTSLGNAMAALGVPFATNSRWRSELYEPERFLDADRRLARSLADLAGFVSLAAATNNSTAIGVRTLLALGVAHYFPTLVGMDAVGESKPSPALFGRVLATAGVPARQAISVGDRYDVDIVPALALGMGGILVHSMEDVYRLPEFLSSYSKS